MKMKLIPEKVGFRISTTDLEVIYTESKGVVLRIDVQTLDDMNCGNHREIKIIFKTVAELKCITLNFFESNIDSFEIENEPDTFHAIDFWKKNGHHPNPHFYQILNSDVLKKNITIYDPGNRLNLKHYLIAGYDSYLEIIASQYELL